MFGKTFVCAYCGELHPLADLSNTSLMIAGTRIREAAIEHLEDNDLICKGCDKDVELFEESLKAVYQYDTAGMTTSDRQWLALNY